MKNLFALLCLASTSSVMAHDDHLLGDGIFHTSYHIIFWSLCALIAYKGIVWFKNKQSTT